MRPEHIRTLQRKEPFKPFLIRLTDGSTHDIHHAELIWVTDDLIGISSPMSDPIKGTVTKAVLVAPEHIIAAEMLPRGRSKAA